MEGRSRRRRERAQRLRERRGGPGAEDSPEEDHEERKGKRHPPRHRKKKTTNHESLYEEDIIDGFAIVSFKSYDDIELVLKSNKDKGAKVAPTLGFEKETQDKPVPTILLPPTVLTNNKTNHKIKKNHNEKEDIVKLEGAASSADTAGTSDEAPSLSVKREPPDSEDNRLSDASSRCSSGRGYICDSEGDDDKASDAGSVLFSASPPPVKKENVEIDSKAGIVLNGHANGTHVDHHISPVLVSPKVERKSPSPQIQTAKSVPQSQPQPQPVVTSQPISTQQQRPTPPTSNGHYPPPVANGNTERRSPLVSYAVSGVSNYPVVSSGYLGAAVSSSYPVPVPVPGVGPNYGVSSSYLPPPPTPYHPPLYAPYSATPYLPHPPPPSMVQSRISSAVTKPVTTLSSPVTSSSTHPSHAPSSHQTLSHQSPASHLSSHPNHQSSSHLSSHPTLNHPSNPPGSHPSSASHHPPPISHHHPVSHQPHLAHPSHQPLGHPIPHQAPHGHSVTPSTTTSTSHRDTVSTPLVARSHSPRGHSPTRERESYSSNVSSLSRGSVSTPVSLPPYSSTVPPSHTSATSHSTHQHTHSSLPYSNKPTVWSSSGASSERVETSSSRTQHVAQPGHSSSHPPPPTSTYPSFPSTPRESTTVPPVSSSTTQPTPTQQPPNPNPFSAESLFQSSQRDGADVLRRELDNRFLVSQDRGPYLRTEMHHHQHQHTHVHQHTTPIIPPPPPLYASPLFKDMPKLGVDSPFYRQSLGLAAYPGYSAGLLHPTLGPSTPFAPPTHIPTFTPKQLTPEPSKPKPVKTGKWNAMHVRIAWEIYRHQQKGPGSDGKVNPSGLGSASLSSGSLGISSGLLPKGEILRPPTHIFGPPHPFVQPHRPPGHFDHTPPTPFPPVGGSMFGRYPTTPAFPALPGYPTHPPVHDPWSRLQPRGLVPPTFSSSSPWASLKTEEERERERTRERARREEKQRRAAQQASLSQQSKPGRERSPVREHTTKEDDHLSRPTDILGRPTVDLLRAPPTSDLLRTAPSDLLRAPPPDPLRPPMDILGRSTTSDILSRPPTDILGRPTPPDLLGRSGPTPASYLQQRHHARHPPLPSHYPTTPHWDHPYRYDPLRFNPLMSAAALREEEEHRAKLYAAYPGSTATLRAKAPSPHISSVTSHSYPPPKEEPSQSR